MDSEDTEDKKEVKDVGGTRKTYLYYIVIIALIIIVFITVFVKGNEISGLQKQIDELKNDNQNLGSQITGYSLKIDSLKSLSQDVKGGNVLFWSEDDENAIMAMVPLNYYSAKIFSERIVVEYLGNATENNLVFKNLNRNGSSWTASFVCKDAVNDNSCGGQVLVDESKKTYSYTSKA